MTSYVDSTLVPPEKVIHRTRLHWIVFLPGTLALASGFVFPPLFLLGVILLLIAFIKRQTSEFAVTDKRVIIKVGWISRMTVEMSLSKIESLDVAQGILGRILDYGTIFVVGTGSTREPFRAIGCPLDFRRAVQAQSS